MRSIRWFWNRNEKKINNGLAYVNPLIKLDGVGPVDNRPSNDKLHHFVKKKYIYIYIVTCDT